jgi:hypothetical protein
MTTITPPEGMPVRVPTWEKYEQDGKVAVLISPGFGAGWATWADEELQQQFAMDRRLVEVVLAKGQPTEELMDEIFGEDQYRYMGGLPVIVEWVDKGRPFYIHEYDGSETIKTTDDLIWTA